MKKSEAKKMVTNAKRSELLLEFVAIDQILIINHFSFTKLQKKNVATIGRK